jgi:hypothetical protein
VRGLLGVTLVGLALLTGCSAPVRPELPSAPPPSATVQLPDDGISLREIGFRNGPVSAFSLPRTSVIATGVDEPSGVTVVLSSPSAADVAGYLRRTLPRSGFVITASDEATASLTFTGYGWQGSFTGTGSASAVTLRP